MDWTICTTLCLQSALSHHVCCSYHIWVPPTPRGDYTELVTASPQSEVTLTVGPSDPQVSTFCQTDVPCLLVTLFPPTNLRVAINCLSV